MTTHKLSIVYSIFLIIVFSLVQLIPCQAMPPLDLKTLPAAPDYAVPEGWLAKPAAPTAPVDVLIIYPTVLFNNTDWIIDTNRPDMRAAAMETVITQASVFEGQANIYAPMYGCNPPSAQLRP
ncbi:MAG: DUF3089 domain-containing protein [Chromatiaceae bacterium]